MESGYRIFTRIAAPTWQSTDFAPAPILPRPPNADWVLSRPRAGFETTPDATEWAVYRTLRLVSEALGRAMQTSSIAVFPAGSPLTAPGPTDTEARPPRIPEYLRLPFQADGGAHWSYEIRVHNHPVLLVDFSIERVVWLNGDAL